KNFPNRRVPESSHQYFPRIAPERLIDSLVTPDGSYGSNPIVGRDRVLIESLEQAVKELSEQFGSDPSTWRYGQERYHHITIRHMLSDAVQPQYRSQFDVGP